MKRELTSDSVVQMAMDLLTKKEYDAVLVILDGAIKKNPKPDYYWLRGRCLERKGDASTTVSEKRDNYKSAIAAYRKTAELDPGMFLVPGSQRPQTTWAVPAYIQLLTYKDNEWKPSLPGSGLSREAIIRKKAANALSMIGSGAREALDALESAIAQENNPHVANDMKEAIKNIRMSDRENEERRSSMRITDEVLRRLGEHEFAGIGVPQIVYTDGLDSDLCLSHADLLQRLASPDVAVRARAICIVGAKKVGTLETCKKIAIGLADKNAIVRCLSVYALGQLASANNTIYAAMNLVPTLVRLLKDDRSLHVRKSAAEALGALGSGSSEALQGLIQVVENGYDPKDKYGKVMVTAIEALGQFGEAARVAVPHISKFKPGGHLNCNESLVVKYEALLRIAPNDRGIAEDALSQIIAEANRGVEEAARFRAIKALGNVPPEKERRVLALVKPLWMDESAENRRTAAGSLVKVDHELAIEAGVLEAGGL